MSTGEPALLVLCIGTERWLRWETVRGLKERCVAPGFEETDFVRFSDPSVDPQAVLEAARTAPFGSPRRLIWVDGLEDLDSDSAPWLKEYLSGPNPQSCVVVCADKLEEEAEMLPPGLQRSGQGRIVRCISLKGGPLEEWIAQRCRQKGKQIELRAVSELVRRAGDGLQALDLALDSLALMAGDSPRIAAADVQALIAPSLRQTAFEILDAAAAGQTGRALLALREAMALNRMNMDQFFGALGWYLRRNRRRWPARRFRESLEDLLRADVQAKQGHPCPEWLADRLLLELR